MNNSHSHKTHRHFVAFPMLLSLILGFVFVNARMFPASLLAGAKEEYFTTGTHALADGISLRVEKGHVRESEAGLEIFGDVTYSAQRFGFARFSEYTAILLGGSMYIHRDSHGVTLAALDAPVLLESSQGTVLVPRGAQLFVESGSLLRQNHIKALPEYWTSQKLEATPAINMKPYGTEGFFALPLSFQTPAETSVFLASFIHDNYLMREMIALRLLEHRQSAESMLLLTRTLDNESIFILPWTQSLGELAEHSEFALPDTFVALWIRMAKRSIALEPGYAANKLLTLAKQTANKFEERGFPLYSKLWMDAYTELDSFARPLLSKEKYRMLNASEQLISTDIIADAANNIKERILNVNSILAAHDIMPTVQTTFSSLAAGRIRCEQLFFDGTHGDSILSFTLDPETMQTSQIMVNGEYWPNTLPLSTLLADL